MVRERAVQLDSTVLRHLLLVAKVSSTIIHLLFPYQGLFLLMSYSLCIIYSSLFTPFFDITLQYNGYDPWFRWSTRVNEEPEQLKPMTLTMIDFITFMVIYAATYLIALLSLDHSHLLLALLPLLSVRG
jgi:hypothetical protein